MATSVLQGPLEDSVNMESSWGRNGVKKTVSFWIHSEDRVLNLALLLLTGVNCLIFPHVIPGEERTAPPA